MLEIGRAILVILAGYAATTVLVILSSVLLVIAFPGPDVNQPTGAYIYGTLITGFLSAMAGGWVVARLAAMRPLAHVAGFVAVIVGLGLMLATSEPEPGQPAWYPWVIILVGAAGALAGGLIRAGRVEKIT